MPRQSWQLPTAEAVRLRLTAVNQGVTCVVKPEWGAKRICQSCGAKFYDMKRDPAVCPKCGTVLDLETMSKPRRSRTAAVAAEPKPPKAAPKRAPSEEELEEAGEELEVEVAEEEEEEEVLEDASELGEDEDDMAEVIDGVDDEGEER
jgi:uncharacterized protein (TIGR02300 family)